MDSPLISAVGQAATVALIVIATRWIYTAKGADFPAKQNGTNVYRIKWQFLALGLAGEGFFIILAVGSWLDLRSLDRVTITASFMAALGLPICLSLATGSITTNQVGITRKGLWHSRSFRWGEVTQLKLHTKHGGAVELRTRSAKMIVDFRIVAFQHLLDEIKNQTGLTASTH
jgi:hypothetical protein